VEQVRPEREPAAARETSSFYSLVKEPRPPSLAPGNDQGGRRDPNFILTQFAPELKEKMSCRRIFRAVRRIPPAYPSVLRQPAPRRNEPVPARRLLLYNDSVIGAVRRGLRRRVDVLVKERA